MNNLENFHVNEGAEGIDNGAFERLKEKMAQARVKIQKDQKQEASQVKKDNVLFNVLMEFIKHLPASHPTVKGIVACLSANLPSLVILSVISLNYRSIEKALPAFSEQELLQVQKSANLPDIHKLIHWLERLKFSITQAKKSDLIKLFHNNNLHPSLRGLIVNTLSEYFKTIPAEQVPVEKVEGYIENILGQISELQDFNKLEN